MFFFYQSGVLSYEQVEQIRAFVLSFGIYAPLIFILLFTLAPLIFFPDGILALSGGLIFGFYMKYTSGQIVPQSGIYGVYTSNGVKTNEATCVKGEPFPPTPAPNMYYKMVRATR